MQSNTNETPYSSLTPALILNAIEQLGFNTSGSLFALNSYENRVYQIGIEDENPLIAKFYRPHRWTNEAILEEHQFAAELASREIPVVAPIVTNDQTLHTYENFRFALFPRQSGRAMESENFEQLEWMGRFIGRIHALGAYRPFKHRIRLDVNTYGYNAYHYLIANDFIPPELINNYKTVVEDALVKIKQCFENAGDVQYIRLHGDCHAGNILWNQTGPQIVDLDDCLMGPAVQDLWMLISSHHKDEADAQLNCLLRGYQEFHDFNYRELSLIGPLRTLRMLNYAAWLARRWKDPAFPLNFPWFNTIRYWQEHLQNIREQVYLLDENEE